MSPIEGPYAYQYLWGTQASAFYHKDIILHYQKLISEAWWSNPYEQEPPDEDTNVIQSMHISQTG